MEKKNKQRQTRGDMKGSKMRLQEIEQELCHSEARNQAFMQLLTDYAHPYRAIIEDMLVREWTMEPFWQLTGFTLEELSLPGWQHLLHPDDLPQLEERMAAIQAGEPDIREWRLMTKSGSVRWVKDSCRPIQQDGRTIVYGAMQDISEQMQMSIQIVEEQRRHEAILEAMVDAITIYDREGRLIQANTAARRLFGYYLQPDIVEKPMLERMQEIYPRDEYGNLLPPEQWPQERVLRGELLRDETALDVWITTLDGRDVLLNICGAPTYDLEGKLTGAVLLSRNVTQRRRREQSTRNALDALLSIAEVLVEVPESQEQTEAIAYMSRRKVAHKLLSVTCDLLDCRTGSIITAHPDTGNFEPVALVGFPVQEREHFWNTISQMHLTDYFDAQNLQHFLAGEVVLLSLSLSPNPAAPTYGIENVLAAPIRIGERLLGILFLDYASIQHLYSLQEEMALVKAVARLAALVIEREQLLQERITAQANALAEHEARRRMDEFLSIASHELRSPLTTMKASLQMAGRQVKKIEKLVPEHVRQRLEEGLVRSERQIAIENRLIGDLLDVSRIQNNKLDLFIRRANLLDIVHEVVADLQTSVYEHRITIQADRVEEIPVMMDSERIGQVLNNYLTNAVKYSRPGTPIVVNVEMDEHHIRVAVQDEGPGLTEEERQHVWERFYQIPGQVVHGSSTGLGLGLYISQNIIRQHGGEVGVESIPGQGSTFWFTLPAS